MLLVILNLILSVGGLAGWFYVWSHNGYATGRAIRVQCGIIGLGIMWLLLVLSDTVQNFTPSGSTVFARVVIVFAFWCLKPLLDKKDV